MIFTRLFQEKCRHFKHIPETAFFILSMKKLIFLLLLLPVSLAAQEKISGNVFGYVYDSISKKAMPDANVFLDKHKHGTITDDDGKFTLKDIPAGRYVLHVQYMGYEPYQQKINLKDNKNVNMRVSLLSSSIFIDEVEVSVQRNESIRNKAYRINMIQTDRLESNPAQNFTEVLDYVPGVNVNNTTGIFSDRTIVSMRGLSGNEQSRVLVLMDGIPLNKSDGGSVNWNQVDREKIKNIKVHKGPGQAIYGSGAMGGVIEITTREPRPGVHGNVFASYGTYNTMKASADVSGQKDMKNDGSLSWTLSSFGTKSDGYSTEAEQFYEIEDSILVPTFVKEWNVSGGVNYKSGKYDRFKLKLNYFDDRRGNGVKVFDHIGAYAEHDTYSSLFNYIRNKENKQLDTRLYFLHEQYSRLYEYMNEGEYKLYDVDSKRKDMGADIRFSWFDLGKHDLLAGINLKNGSVHGVDTYYTSTDIITNAGSMASGALYLQDNISLLDEKMLLTLGVRYDAAVFYDAAFRVDHPSYSIEFMDFFEDTLRQDKHWGAFCPNASLQYRFGEENRIYFSAGRGFRAPTLDDMTRTGKKRGTFKVANPELKPELLDNYELGMDISPFTNLNLGLSAFYSIGHDFMYYVSTGDSVNMGYKITPIIRKENISRVNIYGFEASNEYTLGSRLLAYVNYTWNYSAITEYVMTDPKVDVDLEGKHLTDVPNHKVSAGIVYKYLGFTTNFNFKYIGKRWINDQNIIDDEYLFTDRYPAYSIFNFSLRKTFFNALEAGFSIDNIFNTIYIDNSTQRNPGRMIMGRVGYRF